MKSANTGMMARVKKRNNQRKQNNANKKAFIDKFNNLGKGDFKLTEAVRQKKLLDLFVKQKLLDKKATTEARQKIVSAYGDFSKRKLESAIKYFEEYRDELDRHIDIVPFEGSASDMMLESRDMIDILSKGLSEIQKNNRISNSTRDKIIDAHLRLKFYFDGYRYSINHL